MIRLYVDEDSMDRALIRALRARGVDVSTTLEEGMIERSDNEHLDYATAQGRVLYTCNVADFYHLHTSFLAQDKSHTGIILAPQQRYSVGEQMRRLLNLINTKSAEEVRNRVEFLQTWGEQQ
jgi:predicted nuclease of predicted toxin-antitoxin system